MTRCLLLTIFLLTFAVCAQSQSLSITGPSRVAMQEGNTYHITWNAEGVDNVAVVVHGPKTPLGGDSRGDFSISVADSVPASNGGVDWTVPWIDSIEFFVKLKGLDAAGQEVAATERGYGFRPAALAGMMADGLYLDLHTQDKQRLYVQRGGQITHAYLSTSSADYDWRPPNVHPKTPHDHAGSFRVLDKSPMHWSRLFQVKMPWAMRYLGGHFIHATSPNNYPFLGTPASSGCNRLTESDAYELYQMTAVGTRVFVIGP